MTGKIINDPVYGFISFPEDSLMQIINHPWFQRLRRIRQMGMVELVYPGATHTRFHHSLGACHLMGKALEVLKAKGIPFTQEECMASRLAILLHDVGHGPFSHALEHTLVSGISHEAISAEIMKRLSAQHGGLLDKALAIFDHTYPKRYLHQLVSSQLDMDRMDYLNRDSFYTGVSEGIIGYDRILQMLTVHGQELAVEEKAVHSAEKFIIARRLMYWQVYLHKTVLGAEQLLINILRRARMLAMAGEQLFATPALSHFLKKDISKKELLEGADHLELFCSLDDADVQASVKVWQQHDDRVLSELCRMLINRRLYKVILSRNALDAQYAQLQEAAKKQFGLSDEDLSYYISRGHTSNHTYNVDDERILIARRDGSVLHLAEVDDPLVTQTLAMPVVKNYLCFPPGLPPQMLPAAG